MKWLTGGHQERRAGGGRPGAEWVINRVTQNKGRSFPQKCGLLSALGGQKLIQIQRVPASGGGQGQDPVCLCMGWTQRGSSKQHPAGCFQVAVKMLGLRQGREGGNRVIRMGEKLTAKRRAIAGKERERNDPEGKEGVGNKEEGWGGVQTAVDTVLRSSIYHVFAEFLSLQPQPP